MTALAASNQRIRRLRRLSGRRSARTDEQAFLIEGPTLVAEALRSDAQLEGVYFDETDQMSTEVVDLVSAAERRGIAVHPVAKGVLVGITDSVTPRTVLAVAALPVHEVDAVLDLAVARSRPVIVLVDVRDPGNVGTIIRAVDAAGAVGVVCCTGTADPWSPKVVRSSAGTVLHLPVATGVDSDAMFEALTDRAIPTMATVVDTGRAYDSVSLDGGVAFLFGNEAAGLPRAILDRVDLAVTIPMLGKAESLNVAMAASVLCFEAARQRRQARPASDDPTGESDWTRPPTDDKVNTP